MTINLSNSLAGHSLLSGNSGYSALGMSSTSETRAVRIAKALFTAPPTTPPWKLSAPNASESTQISSIKALRTIIDAATGNSGLPEDVQIIVVGPERPLSRSVQFVREDPPGGGPAAAMVAGLRAALTAEPDRILVLPGDAPHAGRAALLLLEALTASDRTAVVATDRSGFVQPLQLALNRSAAQELVRAAGQDGARGGSARALVNRLDPPALRLPMTVAAHFDVDTPDQLHAWEQRDSPNVQAVLTALDACVADARPGPVVVALDGRSGAGKSTLASALALRRSATVVPGDDFYSSTMAVLDAAALERLSDADVADQVLDWRRLREQALAPLARGEPARYPPYDWQAGDGRLGRPVELVPSDLVIVEGVYSARPELADLVDLAVLVDRRWIGAAGTVSAGGAEVHVAYLVDGVARGGEIGARAVLAFGFEILDPIGDGAIGLFIARRARAGRERPLRQRVPGQVAVHGILGVA